jgi:hypothetical protein
MAGVKLNWVSSPSELSNGRKQSFNKRILKSPTVVIWLEHHNLVQITVLAYLRLLLSLSTATKVSFVIRTNTFLGEFFFFHLLDFISREMSDDFLFSISATSISPTTINSLS